MMSFHAFGVILMTAVFLGAIVQGFSGFAFSAVAGAILLQVQAPGVAIPLLMICSLLIQTFVLVRLRAALSLHGSLPYLVGGAGGVVLATLVFDRLDPHVFRQCFGAFLMVYALSTVLRPKSALLMVKARPVGHTAVGFAGGLVGGLTAMPGAVLAIWCDAHAMPKIAQRAVVQPFIAAVQSLALAFLFLKAPGAPVAVLHHLRHRVARVMVMRSLATLALAALLALQASASHAQALDKPDPAVSAWLPGCRAFLQNTETMGSEGAGQCAGAVDALLYIGELLPADFRYCVPLRTPRGEIIATILDDIEAMRPEVDRQDFKGMVLSILQFHWPCRE